MAVKLLLWIHVRPYYKVNIFLWSYFPLLFYFHFKGDAVFLIRYAHTYLYYCQYINFVSLPAPLLVSPSLPSLSLFLIWLYLSICIPPFLSIYLSIFLFLLPFSSFFRFILLLVSLSISLSISLPSFSLPVHLHSFYHPNSLPCLPLFLSPTALNIPLESSDINILLDRLIYRSAIARWNLYWRWKVMLSL